MLEKVDEIKYIGNQFVMVPSQMILSNAVNDTALRVYCFFVMRSGNKGNSWYGIKAMANELDKSERCIQDAIACLVSNHWIHRQRRMGKSSITYVFQSQEYCKAFIEQCDKDTQPDTCKSRNQMCDSDANGCVTEIYKEEIYKEETLSGNQSLFFTLPKPQTSTQKTNTKKTKYTKNERCVGKEILELFSELSHIPVSQNYKYRNSGWLEPAIELYRLCDSDKEMLEKVVRRCWSEIEGTKYESNIKSMKSIYNWCVGIIGQMNRDKEQEQDTVSIKDTIASDGSLNW